MARYSSSSLVCRYPPSIYATRLVGEVLLAGMELEASDGLGAGCYTGDIQKNKHGDDTAPTACVYPS